VTVAIAAAALLAGSAGAASPGRNGLIAFASERDGLGAGISTMRTDGTGLVRLTGPPPEAADAAFSPDGRSLAFTRVARRSHQFWFANADGTRPHAVLRAGPDGAGAPAWSPDGRWLAFDAGPETHTRISVVHPDGTALRTLVDGADPTWSWDGKTIAFTRSGRSPGIWKIGVDGAAPPPLRRPLAGLVAGRAADRVREEALRRLPGPGVRDGRERRGCAPAHRRQDGGRDAVVVARRTQDRRRES
jgi:dipeptidyl aminopeptidase/acylaminoacyl peptidase